MTFLLKPFERFKTVERKALALVAMLVIAMTAFQLARTQRWLADRFGPGLDVASLLVLALFTWILLYGFRELVLRPLHRARDHFARIGNGDYSAPVLTRRTDEFGDMLRALDRMRINLAAATAAREASERKQRDILERSLQGFYQTTLDGRFLTANPSMARILGYESVEALLAEPPGTTERRYVDIRQRREFVTTMEAQGYVSGFESALRRRDGRVIWIAEMARLVTERDGRQYVEGFVDDVTSRKDAEQIKADFVSFVTHQLRTPLAGIRWMLELAEQGSLEGDVATCVTDARVSAERLIALVNDLLAVTRLESDRLLSAPEPTSLAELTDQVLKELAPLAIAKQQAVQVEAATVPRVLVDPQLARQVVQNFISNAIKYTSSGGAIHIHAVHEGDAVRWTVRDTGIGIPAAAQPRLFEKFFRADNAQVVDTEGTGLGLYLARLIAVRAGGSVACESTEGHGSAFTLTLPVARERKAVA